MKTKLLSLILLTLALALSACSPLTDVNASDPQPTQPEINPSTVITLERTACFGFCPIYTLTIYADGRVEFDGTDFVEMTGKQTGSITTEQVQELVNAFRNADYLNLEDKYEAPVTDIPTTITSFTEDGQTKTVVNYGGCMEESPVRAPQALCDLEIQIDEVTNSSQWIGEQQ